MKIVTLTLAPAIDIHCFVPSLAVGKENFASNAERYAGGKGLNISRALTAFGVENIAILALGEDSHADFFSLLSGEQLQYSFFPLSGRVRENITIHTESGCETRLSFAGAVMDTSVWLQIEKALLCYDENTIVTFTGSMPQGASMSNIKSLIMHLREKGTKVVIDSRSFSKEDLIECRPWLIKPNESEMLSYCQKDCLSLEDAKEEGEKLCQAGIENVMISMGAQGAILCNAGGVFYSRAPEIKPISTIGAGDSMVAGFIVGEMQKLNDDKILAMAVSFGSAACLTEGTTPPEKEQILQLLETLI